MEKTDKIEILKNNLTGMQELQEKITADGKRYLEEAQKILAPHLGVPTKSFNKKDKRELYILLEEHSLYKVMVKSRANNPEHESILFTGFDTGGYWTLYINNYDTPTRFEDIYCIRIIEYLCKTKI